MGEEEKGVKGNSWFIFTTFIWLLLYSRLPCSADKTREVEWGQDGQFPVLPAGLAITADITALPWIGAIQAI